MKNNLLILLALFNAQSLWGAQGPHKTTSVRPINRSSAVVFAQSKMFKCTHPECNKAFIKKSHLTTHIESVHQQIRHKCQTCHKAFTRESTLTAHIKSAHQGVRFECPQCDKIFTVKSNLTIHFKNKHERIKYKCPQCDKTFTEKRSVKTHTKRKHKNNTLAGPAADAGPPPLVGLNGEPYEGE